MTRSAGSAHAGGIETESTSNPRTICRNYSPKNLPLLRPLKKCLMILQVTEETASNFEVRGRGPSLWWRRRNLKLDESCISNPKLETSNWTGLQCELSAGCAM